MSLKNLKYILFDKENRYLCKSHLSPNGEGFAIYYWWRERAVIRPSEKRIKHNIEQLTELDWFQELYKKPEYQILIQKHLGIHAVLESVNIDELKQNEQKMLLFQEKLTDFIEREAENPNVHKYFTI